MYSIFQNLWGASSLQDDGQQILPSLEVVSSILNEIHNLWASLSLRPLLQCKGGWFHMVFVVTYTECLISRCQYLQIVTYQTRVVKEKFWHLKLHSHFLLLPTIHFMLSDLVFSWAAHPTLPPSLTAPPPGPHGPSTSISVSDTHYTQIPPPWLWSFAAPSQSDLLLSLKCCCVHSRHHLAEFSTSCASASLSRFHKKELTCKYF